MDKVNELTQNILVNAATMNTDAIYSPQKSLIRKDINRIEANLKEVNYPSLKWKACNSRLSKIVSGTNVIKRLPTTVVTLRTIDNALIYDIYTEDLLFKLWIIDSITNQ